MKLAATAISTMATPRPMIRTAGEPLAALQDNLAAQASTVAQDDRLRFHALDLAFHEILVTGLDLPRVAMVIEASRANIDRVRRILSSPRRHALTLDEHHRIFQAIEARDPERARRAMEAHLDAVSEELDRFSVERPDAFVTV